MAAFQTLDGYEIHIYMCAGPSGCNLLFAAARDGAGGVVYIITVPLCG